MYKNVTDSMLILYLTILLILLIRFKGFLAELLELSMCKIILLQMNWHMKCKQILDIENRLVVFKGEEVEEEWIESLGLASANSYTWNGYKTGLLYCTGNYIQYPVINHNGKEYEK